jgi:hypothetical protein
VTTTNSGIAGCYASLIGECDRLSAEHYFSKALMRALPGGETGMFNVSGFPWLADGEERRLPRNALQANVLCVRHNNALSPTDTAALRFAEAIKEINDSAQPDRRIQIDQEFRVDGAHLERWLLKVLCGLTASGNLYLTGTEPTRVLDRSWVRLLFDRESWQPGSGLYVGLPGSSFTPGRSGLRATLLHATPFTGRVVAGLRLEVLGFIFVVSVAGPLNNFRDEAVHRFVHRPERLLFYLNSGSKAVVFAWPRPWVGETVRIHRTPGTAG